MSAAHASRLTGLPARPHMKRRVRLALLFIACVVVVDALIGERGLVRLLAARAEHASLGGSIAAIRHENARLRAHIARLRDDPRTIEDIARRELTLLRPGEIVFLIKEIPPDTDQQGPVTSK